MDENRIGKEIVDAAMAVHRELGPGLLETVCEVVLPDEIWKRGCRAERQVPIAIVCRGVRFDEGFRADIIAESKVIIERKSVLGGLARENPDSNQFMHQTAHAALRPLVMMSFGRPSVACQ
jgi:GxxExxY protein